MKIIKKMDMKDAAGMLRDYERSKGASGSRRHSAGKGDNVRPGVYTEEYRSNYDAVFGAKIPWYQRRDQENQEKLQIIVDFLNKLS